MIDYKLDRITRTIALNYIRNYDNYMLWYKAEREKILGLKIIDYDTLDMPRGTTASNPVLTSVELLDKLELSHKVLVIKAINEAKGLLGWDIPDEKIRSKFVEAIWLSCQNGYKYKFETFEYLYYGRTQFYKKKSAFIKDVAMRLGL